MLGQENKDGAVPMEIDRLQMKGKGPKGKGKGKDQNQKEREKVIQRKPSQKEKVRLEEFREGRVTERQRKDAAREGMLCLQVAESPGGGDKAESATVLSSHSSGQATTTRPAIKRIEAVSTRR